MRLSNAFVFPDPEPPAIINIIKVKHFCTVLLYYYI